MAANVRPARVGPYPVPVSDSKERTKSFSEVEQPYTEEQVRIEADRCLRCGNPVCIDACPVQMDVRGMCDAVANGDYRTAFHRIRETNALLGVTARCCPQLQGLCEDACVMRWAGQPISIGMIQRFVSDWEQHGSRQPDPAREKETGRHVSIIGAGPAGLAAASLLSRYGHSVTVYEELTSAGGTALYGIPDYHLPKDVLAYEIERVEGQGVEIQTGVKVGKDVTLSDLREESDAVLITTGAKDMYKLDIPGIELDGVYSGYKFLEDVFSQGVENYIKNPTYDLGREVLVIGGGDTASDCARTALRLIKGGKVTIAYRRSENEMHSYPPYLQQTKDEGVRFKFNAGPKGFNGSNGKLVGVTMSTMRLGKPDASGRKRPEPIPGKDFEMGCDIVLLATGRGPNSFVQMVSGLKTGQKNSVAIDDRYRTSVEGVFAGGDVTTGETLVVKSMGEGREAAQRVHEYLMGLEEKHVSLYEKYYEQKLSEASYQNMLFNREEKLPPP